MFSKINRLMGKISIPINVLNIIVGLFFGIAHVYLPFTSLTGLILGMLMSVSGALSMATGYWFTLKNSRPRNTATIVEQEPILENTPASNLWIATSVPLLLLGAACNFFGTYTGTLLLVAALGLAIAPPVAIAVIVALSTVFTVSCLMNSWLQTHNIWESLKKPAVPPAPPLVQTEAPQPTYRDAMTQTEELELAPTPHPQQVPLPRPQSKVSLTAVQATAFHKRQFSAPAAFSTIPQEERDASQDSAPKRMISF